MLQVCARTVLERALTIAALELSRSRGLPLRSEVCDMDCRVGVWQRRGPKSVRSLAAAFALRFLRESHVPC